MDTSLPLVWVLVIAAFAAGAGAAIVAWWMRRSLASRTKQLQAREARAVVEGRKLVKAMHAEAATGPASASMPQDEGDDVEWSLRPIDNDSTTTGSSFTSASELLDDPPAAIAWSPLAPVPGATASPNPAATAAVLTPPAASAPAPRVSPRLNEPRRASPTSLRSLSESVRRGSRSSSKGSSRASSRKKQRNGSNASDPASTALEMNVA